MKVILLEKYRKLGEVGDVVEVRGGYARNFLIPSEKAVQATKENIANFEAKKAELVKQSKEKEEAAKKIADKISNKIVTVIKQAGDDGRLYGSVATSEIAEGLTQATKVDIDRKQITLNSSIKFLGFYQVTVDLGESVFANIYANISRTESEAQEIEAKFLKGKVALGPLSGDKHVERVEEVLPANDYAPAKEEKAEEKSEEVSEVAEKEAVEA